MPLTRGARTRRRDTHASDQRRSCATFWRGCLLREALVPGVLAWMPLTRGSRSRRSGVDALTRGARSRRSGVDTSDERESFPAFWRGCLLREALAPDARAWTPLTRGALGPRS